MKKMISRWSILIAALLIPALFTELKGGFGQENGPSRNENESSKSIHYLQNARGLLNQTSVEYKNKNYTGAEELATDAYLDNFEYVEHVLEQKGSHSMVQNIEHLMREELRDLLKNKANQTEIDKSIKASDVKLLEAIDLLNVVK